jgi:CheY-like chemotaxis protein
MKKTEFAQKPFRTILCGCAAPEKYFQLDSILASVADEVVLADYGRKCFELALDRFRSGPPFDLVALDVDLPRIGGYSVTALLRENGYSGAIVSFSSVDMPFYEFDSERCGCDAHLSGRNLLQQLRSFSSRTLANPDHAAELFPTSLAV